MAFDNSYVGYANSDDVLGSFCETPTADRMAGGTGDDVYLVDSRGDRVIEGPGGGDNDLVISTVTYHLGNYVENLILVGEDKIGGWGNDGDNIIIGNCASNTLVGGAGDDAIDGGSGDDRIHGGLGTDVLWGGEGNDLFVFDVAVRAANVDYIFDFTSGEDKIGLDKKIFSFLGSTFDADEFAVGAATSHKATIVFDQETGALSFDTDGTGSGAAVTFAYITNAADVAFSDIVLVA